MDNNEKIYDVCIVGAGFSGLVLAIKLARAGLLVCLAELNRVVGRRILSTGNGRCNFTNSRMGSAYYYSNHSLDFIEDNHGKGVFSTRCEQGSMCHQLPPQGKLVLR